MAVHIVSRVPVGDYIIGYRVKARDVELTDKEVPVMVGNRGEDSVIMDDGEGVERHQQQRHSQHHPPLVAAQPKQVAQRYGYRDRIVGHRQ